MADSAVLVRRAAEIGVKTALGARRNSAPLWRKGTRRFSASSAQFLLGDTGKATGNDALSTVGDSDTRVNIAETHYHRAPASMYTSKPWMYYIRSKRIKIHGRRLLDNLSSGYCTLIFIRAYGSNGDYQEPLYKNKSAYYDILGVSEKATQAQIKTAYYKQSFSYHPDRNAGSDEATQRFSEISEAYTVLGNKALRKKYDRGLLSSSDLTAGRTPSKGPGTAGSKPQSDPRSRATVELRGGKVFDFDQFIKSHYGDQLQRERNMRLRREELKKTKEGVAEKNVEMMTGLGVGMLLFIISGVLLSLK